MARPRKEQVAGQRRNRVKFGDPKLRMSVDPDTAEKFKREGLVARWVNDTAGRIDNLQMRGYDFVTDRDAEVKAGEDAGNSDLGTRVSKIVGTGKNGEPIRAYLMTQRQEDYLEDQEIKEQDNQKVDEAIRRGEAGGQAASVKSSAGQTYVKNIDYQP